MPGSPIGQFVLGEGGFLKSPLTPKSFSAGRRYPGEAPRSGGSCRALRVCSETSERPLDTRFWRIRAMVHLRVLAEHGLLRSCHVCPRDCQVNRWENKTGICMTGRRARVSSAFAHHGEEDCLRGGMAQARSSSAALIWAASFARSSRSASSPKGGSWMQAS